MNDSIGWVTVFILLCVVFVVLCNFIVEDLNEELDRMDNYEDDYEGF